MTSIAVTNPQTTDVFADDQGRAVTTSLAVAERFGKRHDDVLKSIRSLECSEEFSLRNFAESGYTNDRGKSYPMYTMTRDGFTFLVMGYTGKDAALYKEGYIAAFNELEKRQAMPSLDALRNPDNLIALLGDYAKETKRLTAKLEEVAPKVAFAEQVEIAEDAITVSQAAKILDTGRKRLFAYLREIGWITRRNEPYQEKITSGLLNVKLGSWEHPEQGLQQAVTTLVTGKGLAKLQQMRKGDQS